MRRARTAPTATGTLERTRASGRPVPDLESRPETRLGQRFRRVPITEIPTPRIIWAGGGTSRTLKKGLSALLRRRILGTLGLL
jgi:hypothetical protein